MIGSKDKIYNKVFILGEYKLYNHYNFEVIVVIRDSNGSFIGGATCATTPGSAIEAEARGFELALQLIQQMNLFQIIIESDAKVIVDAIDRKDPGVDWRISSTVHACMNLLNARADISIVFSPRDTNRVAHNLASYAITNDVTRTWIGGVPPPFMLDTLFADLANSVIPRFPNE